MKNNDLPAVVDDRGKALSLSKMSINVSSNNPMEVTVSKTCLEVLNKLAKVGFTKASRMKLLFNITEKVCFMSVNQILK